VTETGEAEQPGLVVLGRIVRAQGLRGEVRVKPFGISPHLTERIGNGRLFARPSAGGQGAVRETAIERQRWQRDAWVVGLRGLADRTEAESLVGWELCLAESDLPPLGSGEYYNDELIGLRMESAQTGEVLGEVIGVQPSAAADLLQVRKPGGGLFFVPLVRAMIVEINLYLSTIRVDLPEGLMDVNG
jgi:16S rRNA processing protein RimM